MLSAHLILRRLHQQAVDLRIAELAVSKTIEPRIDRGIVQVKPLLLSLAGQHQRSDRAFHTRLLIDSHRANLITVWILLESCRPRHASSRNGLICQFVEELDNQIMVPSEILHA